jgi:hypothetical protein
MGASKMADFVRKIHVKTKEAIEKKGKYTADHTNKKQREVLFQPSNMIWVHFRKVDFQSYVSPSCCPMALVLTRWLPR